MTAYSAVSDLLIDDLTVSASFPKQKYVDDAADEMNIKIGKRYDLPIDVNSLSQPSRLLLKRINNYLASGRIILRLAISSEQTKLHELGAAWVKEALDALCEIAEGKSDLVLTDGSVLETDPYLDTQVGPKTTNVDDSSPTDSYYEYFDPSTWPTVYPPYGVWVAQHAGY